MSPRRTESRRWRTHSSIVAGNLAGSRLTSTGERPIDPHADPAGEARAAALLRGAVASIRPRERSLHRRSAGRGGLWGARAITPTPTAATSSGASVPSLETDG